MTPTEMQQLWKEVVLQQQPLTNAGIEDDSSKEQSQPPMTNGTIEKEDRREMKRERSPVHHLSNGKKEARD